MYGSNWYKSKLEIQMDVGFILIRSQKPIVITSAFFSASLETFMSVSRLYVLDFVLYVVINFIYILQIIRTAGSYITLLQAIAD